VLFVLLAVVQLRRRTASAAASLGAPPQSSAQALRLRASSSQRQQHLPVQGARHRFALRSQSTTHRIAHKL
jgi:hypothetical protein